MLTPEATIDHTYHIKENHAILLADLMDETKAAIRHHDSAYLQNPLGYFQAIETAKKTTENGQPYLHFRGEEDSETELMILQLPFANRVSPANTAVQLTEYAVSDAKKLPKGLNPNSVSQAIKHHLAYTAIQGLRQVHDHEGRKIPLVVVGSPASDYHKQRLGGSDRKQMKHGDVTPHARPLIDIAEELESERVHIGGYSFGSAVAAQAARLTANFDVESLIIAEPTTHMDRGLLRVIGDYTVLDIFNGSSGDTSIEKTPGTGWLEQGPKARRDIARNGDGLWQDSLYGNGNIRTNLQIARALGKPTLEAHLKEIIKREVPTTIFYAEDSLMSRGIEEDFLPRVSKMALDAGYPDLLQILKATPLASVPAKHAVGEIPSLYADILARGMSHAFPVAA